MGEYYGVRRTNDPDGEFLQHWGILKGAMREGHKYLARLVTPSGYRYIYNQAELAAAKAGKAVSGAAKSASNAANSAYRAVRKGVGIDARERAQRTSSRAERLTSANRGREQSVSANRNARMARGTAKRAQAAYDRTLLGRAEKAFNSGRKAVTNAANEAGRQISGAANDAQRYVNKQIKKGQKAIKDYQDFRNLPDGIKNNAAAADRAGKKTMKVGIGPLSRNVSVQGADMANRIWGVERAIRNAPKNAAKAISDTANDVSKAANKTYKKARKQAIQTGKDISKAANDTYKSVSREASRTAKRVGKQIDRTVDQGVKAAEKATGVSARRSYKKSVALSKGTQKLYGKNSKAANDSYKNTYKYKKKYDSTPLGRVEGVVDDLNAYRRNATTINSIGKKSEPAPKKKKKKTRKAKLVKTGNATRAQLTRHTGGNF